MSDDVLINKAATIERCVARARDEYAKQPNETLADDFTRQDAAILNIQRACEIRKIAVHDYQALQLPIAVAIIKTHLVGFLHYSKTLLLRDGQRNGG